MLSRAFRLTENLAVLSMLVASGAALHVSLAHRARRFRGALPPDQAQATPED